MTAWRIAIGAVAATLALPAAAADWAVPPGCSGFLTVQSKECRVSNHYRCSNDSPDRQWQADFDVDGLMLLTQTDAEARQWRIVDPRKGTDLSLDPMSSAIPKLSDLLRYNPDTALEQWMTGADGKKTFFLGFVQVIDEAVVIDGIALQRTVFNISKSVGDTRVVSGERGFGFVHPEWRLMFAGAGERFEGDMSNYKPHDGSPVDFVFADEPGFLSTRPIHDCEMMVSSAEILGSTNSLRDLP
ncbi:hypothetical protein [Tabrizicola sp.]|uniref:hypothetical protein n=1 Tax=Tabrizicola sp. TaxID=2005166 RepID=UPI00286D17FF|nr:hypothetical protein [Tabrizicola sp.]